MAYYDPAHGRIEMHLESLTEQTVNLQGQLIKFKAGERIWTESSYKYTLDTFSDLARQAGFDAAEFWMDYNRFFSVIYLEPIQGNEKE